MKDLYAYRNQPGQTLANKMHPGIAAIMQMLNNEDFYGTRFAMKVIRSCVRRST